MANRTWVRLLGATLGVAALAGACQLGVAYGLGILRLTRVLDVTTRDQWTAQLAWVAWFTMMAAVAGGFAGVWLLPRWSATRPTPGTAVAVAVAAGVGAAIVVPLTMQPARTAQIAGVHPVFVIGVCAGLGALAGVFAAVAALLQPVSRWGLVALGGVVWLIAIVSVLPSLAPDDPLPSVRLGVFDAGFLSPGATQRTALFTMPAVALIAGALLGWRARRRELPTLTIALAGLPGPALLTAAYLIAGPGSGTDHYQVVPYWAAMTATGAGVLGSVLAAVLNRPDLTERVDSDTGVFAISGTAAGELEPDSSPVSAEPFAPPAADSTSPPPAPAETKRPRFWGRRRSGPDSESPMTTTSAESATDGPTSDLSPTRPDAPTEMRPDMHRETRPESWLDTPVEKRPETLDDTPSSPARSEWTTHDLGGPRPGDTGSLATDDLRGAAGSGAGGRVVLGDDADEPEPFDAFRRPGTDQRGLGYGTSNRPAQHAAHDSGPYVPEPALRPLPPGVAQEERTAGGRLGRSLRPFSRGRTEPAPTSDFPPAPAGAPIPDAPQYQAAPSTPAPPATASSPYPDATPYPDAPPYQPAPPYSAASPYASAPPTPAPDSRRSRHGLEPATDSDPYTSAEAAPSSADDSTKRRGWRRSRPAPADEPIPAPADTAPPAPAVFDASTDNSEAASESKRAARKRKKDEEFVDWVSGLGGE